MMENLKMIWLVVSKLTQEIWRILIRALESFKNLHFNGLLLTKVYKFWAKKEVLSFMTLESDVTLEEKLVCSLETNIKDLANFHRALESLKIGTFVGYFYPK